MNRKISLDYFLVKFILLTPLTMLLQRLFNPANKVLMACILLMLVWNMARSGIQKKTFILISTFPIHKTIQTARSGR